MYRYVYSPCENKIINRKLSPTPTLWWPVVFKWRRLSLRPWSIYSDVLISSHLSLAVSSRILIFAGHAYRIICIWWISLLFPLIVLFVVLVLGAFGRAFRSCLPGGKKRECCATSKNVSAFIKTTFVYSSLVLFQPITINVLVALVKGDHELTSCLSIPL